MEKLFSDQALARVLKGARFGRRLTEYGDAIGREELRRRGERMERCNVLAVNEEVWHCGDQFCPACGVRLIPYYQERFARMGDVQLYFCTFTWRGGLHADETTVDEIKERTRQVAFALQDANGGWRWEFTERPDGTYHAHVHAVTDAPRQRLYERFGGAEKNVFMVPFFGGVQEFVKYASPDLDESLLRLLSKVHGRRVRFRRLVGSCFGKTATLLDKLGETTKLEEDDHGAWGEQITID